MRRIVGTVQSAFAAALDRFAVAPGARKVVVLISPGFPRAENVPIYRLYDFFRETSPAEYRNVGLIEHAAQLASELEYTMYTLDPSGTNVNDVDASHGRPPRFTDIANVRFWREADRKDNLIRAAQLTGGEAIFTSDAGAALADLDRLTASYYSLAFQPGHAGDGKEHTLRVEVSGRPGLQLAYRTSYVDRPAEQREAERARAALLTGETANPLGVELILAKPTSKFHFAAQGMRLYRMNAEVRIPYAHLTMLPRGDVAWGQVQVVVVATDERGNLSDLAHQRIPIEISAAKLEEARRRALREHRHGQQQEWDVQQRLRSRVQAILQLSESSKRRRRAPLPSGGDSQVEVDDDGRGRVRQHVVHADPHRALAALHLEDEPVREVAAPPRLLELRGRDLDGDALVGQVGEVAPFVGGHHDDLHLSPGPVSYTHLRAHETVL